MSEKPPTAEERVRQMVEDHCWEFTGDEHGSFELLVKMVSAAEAQAREQGRREWKYQRDRAEEAEREVERLKRCIDYRIDLSTAVEHAHLKELKAARREGAREPLERCISVVCEYHADGAQAVVDVIRKLGEGEESDGE